jgi:hypothetical protein
MIVSQWVNAMMRSTALLFVCTVLASLVGVLLPAAPAWGQADDPAHYLAAEKLKSADNSRYNDLRNGRVAFSADAAENRRVLELAAQWYVNRLTWGQFRDGTPENGNTSKMSELVREAIRQVPEYRSKRELEPNQQMFVDEFSKQLVTQIKAVLKSKWPISQINAAMILAHLGRVGFEEAADTMVEIVNDPKQIDAVKLYALRGLKELFALQRQERPFQFKDREREVRSIQALLKFLDRTATPAEFSLGDAEAFRREVEAFRWVRREALMALGETRFPALLDKNKRELADGLTAWQLLRTCCKDGFQPDASKEGFKPEPSIAERVEAAISACRLDPKLTPGLQVDYLAHGLGFVVRDFVVRYNEDYKETKGKSFVWRYDALRLAAALQALRTSLANVRDKKAVDYANELIAKYESGLGIIEKDPRQFVDSTYITSLEETLTQRLPAAKSVYQDVPTSVVKPPAAREK